MAVVLLASAAFFRASAASSVEDVRQAALATYIHGMTAEIAHREVGTEGVPQLVRLLHDPDFPRRDNVVAFLAFLGTDETTPALVRFLDSPPRRATVPEEDRALLLAPRALGEIASRGGSAALEALLAMTEPGGAGGLAARAARAAGGGPSLEDDLVEMALRGLARSGAPQAVARLRQVARGSPRPAPGGRDLRDAAQRALRLASGQAEESSPDAPAGALQLDAGPPAPPAVAAGELDNNPRVDDSALTYVNHVNVPTPMDDGRLDDVLREASLRAGRDDYDIDIACCITLSRGSSAGSFGSANDGLDVIEDQTEMSAVLGNRSARVKIVRDIEWCGGAGMNIVGCSYKPGDSMVITRLSNLAAEAILWIHEYGHNVDLGHTTDSRDIMYGTNNGNNRGLDQDECDHYHAPPAAAHMSPSDVGACTDGDVDDVQDVIDNCPSVANTSQQDSNHNGVGDACEGADADGDGVPDVADNCPGVSNPAQTDSDHDGSGDACDPCTDADGDGYGAAGGTACPAGAQPDCDDDLASVHPGAVELCDGLDNDCNQVTDETRCEDFDVNSDARVDGLEVAWLARSFGTCSASPASEWWYAVDYDRDGCVDGEDLAILASVWNCVAPSPVCQ